MLILGLSEDSLHHDVKHLVVDGEVFGCLRVETLLR